MPDGTGGFTTGGFATPGRVIPQADAEALADALDDVARQHRLVLPSDVLTVLRAGGAVEIA